MRGRTRPGVRRTVRACGLALFLALFVVSVVLLIAGGGHAQETYGFQNVQDIEFVGDVAIVPDGLNQTVVALDMTDPTDPFAISFLENPCTTGTPAHLDVDGDFAYITMGGESKMCIVDISDPASMQTAGSVSSQLLDFIQQVTIQGDFAYACGGQDTQDLVKINVTDRTDPQVVTSVTSSDFENCLGLDGKGDLVYTSQNDPTGNFRISNDTAGELFGLEGSVQACQPTMVLDPARDFAYCPHRANGRFEVVDVSNEASPSLAATLSPSGEEAWANVGYDSATQTAYVMGRVSEDGFHSIDVSTPTSPVLLDSIAKPNSDFENGHNIEVFSDHAYVPARTNGFNIFNVTDTSNLQHVALINEVLVAPGPTVNITNPLEGSTHLTNATVNVTANITEGTDPINSVILDTNGDGVFNITANLTETSLGEFEVFGDWNVGTDAGSRDIVVQAFDTQSRSGGDVVGVTVNTLNLTFLNPVENDTLTEGKVINVTGRVEEIGAGFNTSQPVPFDSGGDAGTFELNVTEVSAGVYEVWGDWKVGEPVGERFISFAATDTLGQLHSAGTTVTIQEAEPPIVNITNPVEDQEVGQGETVNVTATITEGDFALDEGDNTPLLDTNQDDPGVVEMNLINVTGEDHDWEVWFEFEVKDPAGARDLVVQAFDVEANSGGDVVTVTVLEANPPSVTITNPPESSEHIQGTTVNVTANITEGDFGLDPSTIVLDTNGDGTFLMNTSDQGGGEWIAWANWTVGDPIGERNLVVQAFDTESNSGGDTVTVTVREPEGPSVVITAPDPGSNHLQASAVNVTATITEGDLALDEDLVLLDPNEEPSVLLTMNVTNVTGEDHDYVAWAHWNVGSPAGFRTLAVQAFDTDGNSGGDTVAVTVNLVTDPEDQDTRWADLVGLDVNPASSGYQVWVRDRGDPAGSQTRIGTYDDALALIADEAACISTGSWSDHFLFGEAPSPWDGAMGITALQDSFAVAACEQSDQDAVSLHVLGPDAQPLELDDVDFSPKILLEPVVASQTPYLATEAVRLDRNIFGAPVGGDGIDFEWVLWDWREENVVWEGTIFDTGTLFGDVAMSVDPDHPTAGVTIPGDGSRVGTGFPAAEQSDDGVSIVLDGDVAFLADPSGAEAVQRYEDATTADWNLTHEAPLDTLGGFPAANSLHLTADGKILTLVGGEQDSITLYDATDLSAVAVINHTGLRGAALAQDHQSLFAFDQDTVYVYDVQDELASADLAPETITPDPVQDPEIPEEPTDFADGIDAAISGLGFQTGPSKMFFSLGLIGITTVATAAGLRIMSSGRPKNIIILLAGALVGLFTVLLGFVDTWMYIVSLVVAAFVLGGGIQEAKNTFQEIQDQIREAREPTAQSPDAPLPDPMHPPMKRGTPDLEDGLPSDATIREVDPLPTEDDA